MPVAVAVVMICWDLVALEAKVAAVTEQLTTTLAKQQEPMD
jgi:hypothetical protein